MEHNFHLLYDIKAVLYNVEQLPLYIYYSMWDITFISYPKLLLHIIYCGPTTIAYNYCMRNISSISYPKLKLYNIMGTTTTVYYEEHIFHLLSLIFYGLGIEKLPLPFSLDIEKRLYYY